MVGRADGERPDVRAVGGRNTSGDSLLNHFIRILEDRIDRAAWRASANCLGFDPEVFFPGRGDREGVRRAKAVCAPCLVRMQCLDDNLHQRDGVYGGLSGRERRALRKERHADGVAA